MDVSSQERSQLANVFESFDAVLSWDTPERERDLAIKACAILRKAGAFSQLEHAVADTQNCISGMLEHLKDVQACEIQSRVEELAGIISRVEQDGYDFDEDIDNLSDAYFDNCNLFEGEAGNLVFRGENWELGFPEIDGRHTDWELFQLGRAESQGTNRLLDGVPEYAYGAAFALWKLDAAVNHLQKGNCLVLRVDVDGKPCHAMKGSGEHLAHLTRATEYTLEALQAVSSAELLLNKGVEHQVALKVRRDLAKSGGKAKAEKQAPLTAKAYELARAKVPSGGQWSSRSSAVYAILDEVKALGKKLGVPLSEMQAFKTINGWLAKMPDASTLFASKQGTSAGKRSPSTGRRSSITKA